MEVLYVYNDTIRAFMGFRSVIILWAYYCMLNCPAKQQLCYLLVLYDIYVLYAYLNQQQNVVRHQRLWMPVAMQSSMILAGISLLL